MRTSAPARRLAITTCSHKLLCVKPAKARNAERRLVSSYLAAALASRRSRYDDILRCAPGSSVADTSHEPMRPWSTRDKLGGIRLVPLFTVVCTVNRSWNSYCLAGVSVCVDGYVIPYVCLQPTVHITAPPYGRSFVCTSPAQPDSRLRCALRSTCIPSGGPRPTTSPPPHSYADDDRRGAGSRRRVR